jgi:hypothetical protein
VQHVGGDGLRLRLAARPQIGAHLCRHSVPKSQSQSSADGTKEHYAEVAILAACTEGSSARPG